MPNGGIWIDLKQLGSHVYEYTEHLSNKDRIRIGDDFVKAYLNSVSTFPHALLTKEETITIATTKKEYTITIVGEKQKYIDEFTANFYTMAFLAEYIYKNHLLQNWMFDIIEKKHNYMTMCLNKIDKGIVRWRRSTARQASISERELSSSDEI